MATAYERRPGSVPGYDWKAAATASRRFLVDVAPSNVTTAGTITGLPAINSPHPTIVGARVDQITAIPIDGKADWCDVEVSYSTNRTFRFPTPTLDPTTQGFQSFSGFTETVTTEIEIAKKIQRVSPSPSGGAPVIQSAWSYGEGVVLRIIEKRQVWSLRLVLNSFTSSDRAAIFDQVNKIHELDDGGYYLFEGANITQTTDTAWELRYTWVGDPGTQAPQIVNASPVQNGNIIVPPGTGGSALFRSPFGVWKAIDPALDGNGTPITPTGYPFFVQQFPYAQDLQGWQNLPGVT